MVKKSCRKKKKMATTSNPQADAASLLTDDLIVEILSRLPARSVHRFKCVSPSWRDLIADPAHRKKLPHTLAGFLYNTCDRVNPCFYNFHFANVSVGATPPLVDPSLPFLPPDQYLYVDQADTCNGLLLCLVYVASSDVNAPAESHYVVCNPAIKRWVDLPPEPEVVPLGRRIVVRLAFDPASSPQFHVFQFEENEHEPYITGVNIYSSQTGSWNYRKSRLGEKISLSGGLTSVYFHGMLHLLGRLHPMDEDEDEDAVMVIVDMEGQVWKTVRVPPSGGLSYGTIGLSEGCLHYATTPPLAADDNKKKQKEVTKIGAVWCMKDYDSKEWVLKHTVTSDDLPSTTRVVYYRVAAIHPDHDAIFLIARRADTLASYDMQHRKFCRILKLKKKKGQLFLPYVPLFSDSLPGVDGQ